MMYIYVQNALNKPLPHCAIQTLPRKFMKVHVHVPFPHGIVYHYSGTGVLSIDNEFMYHTCLAHEHDCYISFLIERGNVDLDNTICLYSP